MSQRILCWNIRLVFLLLWACIAACGTSGKKGSGEICETNDDCEVSLNLECRGKRCRTPLPSHPPVAKAVINPSALVGNQVQLDASGSSDPLGDNLGLRFAWSIAEKPASSKATVDKSDQMIASFIPDVAGNYTVEVNVQILRGGQAFSAKAQASLQAELPPNQKPVAHAGGDQLVVPGLAVSLDGSKSSDPEGQDLTYLWTIQTKPQGSQATLSDPTAVKPTFKTDLEGRYILSLVVKDTRSELSDPDTVTIEALEGADKTPTLAKISPVEGVAYQTQFKVTLEGSNLVKGAKFRIDKYDFATIWKSDTQLESLVNLVQVGPGEHKVQVVNTNGKGSNELSFKVTPIPAPTLASLDPAQGFFGINKMLVTAKGNHFIVDHSKVIFGTVELITRVKSPTEIEFDLDLQATPVGEYPVKIANPGGQSSNTLIFRVLDKLLPPILTVLNPPSGVEGTRLNFSVHGQGFAEGAVILFDNKPLASVRRSRDEMAAAPQLDLTQFKPGEYNVSVKNPDGQETNKEIFRVREKDPSPKLSRILPFTLYLNEVFKEVAIYGNDFLPGVRVMIGNNEITGSLGSVSYKSDTFIVASVDLTNTTKWTSGDVDAIVINPNNKTSNPFKLSLSYRIPTINALLPSSWSTRCDTDVEIFGSNFLPSVVVNFGPNLSFSTTSTTNKLNYVSDQKLTFKLNTTKMNAGSYNVSVENGASAKATTTFALTSTASPTPVVGYVSPGWGRADTKVLLSIQPDFSNSTNLQSLHPGAVIDLGGKLHPTVCSSSSSTGYCYSMDATLDLTGYKPGIYDFVVVNPCDVRGPTMSFVVESAPAPYISKFEPALAQIGDKTKILIKGGHFTQKHTLTWNGKIIDTVFISDTELETKDLIDFSTATVGDVPVAFKNDNGLTASTQFSVVQAFAPHISDVSNNKQSVGPLQDMEISGTGFVLSSVVNLNGTPVPSKFVSATQIALRGLDTSALQPGMHTLQVRNGTRVSNLYPLALDDAGGPTIDYLSPSFALGGTQSTVPLYIYGDQFSVTPRATIQITGPDNQDYSTNFVVASFYNTFVRGDFKVAALKPGRYVFVVKNPNQSVSNRSVFTISPPPPPAITAVRPTFGYRGNTSQQIIITGSNFSVNDQVIFNQNLLNPIPVTYDPNTPTEVTIQVNLSKIKAQGAYELYVRRCIDSSCAQIEKSKTLTFQVNDPPCSAINCATELQPVGSEKCDATNGNVCRPTCTTDQDCKTIDAKATWSCKSGFCN